MFQRTVAILIFAFLTILSAYGTAWADPAPTKRTGTGTDPNRIIPDNGWWWAATEPGRGYSIEANLTKGTGFIAAFVYDDTGKANWYVATLSARPTEVISQGFYGPFTITTSMVGTLQRVSGGQTLGGPFKAATVTDVGQVVMAFTDFTEGRITWPTSVSQLETRITRYPVSGSSIVARDATVVPETGWWYNEAEGGRGYFLEAQGRNMFFAGYMYRTDGTPVWYVSSPTVAMTTNSSFTATLVEVSNGPTFANPTSRTGTTTNVGTVSAVFSSPTSGTLTFNGGTPIAITRYSGF